MSAKISPIAALSFSPIEHSLKRALAMRVSVVCYLSTFRFRKKLTSDTTPNFQSWVTRDFPRSQENRGYWDLEPKILGLGYLG